MRNTDGDNLDAKKPSAGLQVCGSVCLVYGIAVVWLDSRSWSSYW